MSARVGPKFGYISKPDRTHGGNDLVARQTSKKAAIKQAQLMAQLMKEANADPQAMLERIRKWRADGTPLLPEKH